MSLHIIESNNQFIIVEVFSYRDRYYSKIHQPRFKLLDLAEKYVKLCEDEVPVNSVQGGNVSNFSPLLLRKVSKRHHQRLSKYIKAKLGLK